jgi:hypothetical protein
MGKRPKTRKSRSAAPPRRQKIDEIHSSIYLPGPVYWALHDIAAERGRATGKRVKMHALLMEGIDAVFKRHGRPSIAELTQVGDGR